MASVDEILEKASQLSRAERAELICFLLDSLDPEVRKAVEDEAGITSEDLKAFRVDTLSEEEAC